MRAYDFTFYSTSIAIQHVETARPYRTLTCVHWSTVPYNFGHLSVAVRRLIRLICISARPSIISSSIEIQYVGSSVRRFELLARFVLRGSAHRFFGTSMRHIRRRRVRQLFGTLSRTSSSARPLQFSTSILRRVAAARPSSTNASALLCVVSVTVI